MAYSLNETKSVLKQALEGMGAAPHLQESATDALIYAHQYGYASLDQQLAFVIHNTSDDLACRATDFDQQPLLCAAFASQALMIQIASELEQTDVTRVRLDTGVPVGEFAHLAVQLTQTDYYVVVENSTARLLAKPQQMAEVYQRELSGMADKVVQITVARQAILTPDRTDQVCWSSAQAQACSQSHIDKGLDISHRLWRALSRWASRVLVVTSARSRRGAGA